MKNFFVRLYDTILPPHPDVVVVREMLEPPASSPHKYTINDLPITVFLPYRNPEVGACIRAVKYHHHQKAITILGQVLRQHLEYFSQDTLIVPIPLSPARLRQRGHNQVVSILTAADIPYEAKVLTRTERHSQTTLTRADRFLNVTGVMAIAPGMEPLVTGKKLLIVDDVVTTGATLAEAGRAIAIARPASVHYVTLAH